MTKVCFFEGLAIFRFYFDVEKNIIASPDRLVLKLLRKSGKK